MALTRRALLGAGAASGIAAAGVAGYEIGSSSSDSGSGAAVAGEPVAFYGRHQAGIATPAQDRLHFAAFDVVVDDRAACASCCASGPSPPRA